MNANVIVWDGAESEPTVFDSNGLIAVGLLVAECLATVLLAVSLFYIECFDYGWFNSCWPF